VGRGLRLKPCASYAAATSPERRRRGEAEERAAKENEAEQRVAKRTHEELNEQLQKKTQAELDLLNVVVRLRKRLKRQAELRSQSVVVKEELVDVKAESDSGPPPPMPRDTAVAVAADDASSCSSYSDDSSSSETEAEGGSTP
jgi:hypothetical protein